MSIYHGALENKICFWEHFVFFLDQRIQNNESFVCENIDEFIVLLFWHRKKTEKFSKINYILQMHFDQLLIFTQNLKFATWVNSWGG